ncbi:trypsin-like peptidase domain-containing protein [Rhizobium etli]|uniref:trypsin-like peptidase domain-containing protein n=1 Tax=Rhizobium etli TaxID=29449 RepID=UPI00040F0CC9|nr:trypsin-like peptidase domain-containing protein [Rhizobium etli]
MTEVPYLSNERIDDIAKTVIEVIGYNETLRGALLRGLPRTFVTSMASFGSNSGVAMLHIDLDRLNNIPRLSDGTIPLRRFLENAIIQSGSDAREAVFQDALHDLMLLTSGFKVQKVSEFSPEVVIFNDDMVEHTFMVDGLAAANAVAKLTVFRCDDADKPVAKSKVRAYAGTGWLLSPTLLLTNHHVIAARNAREPEPAKRELDVQALSTEIILDYNTDKSTPVVFSTKALLSCDELLDYAVLRIDDTGRKGLKISTEAADQLGKPVNIIQHPGGRAKLFAIRNNIVVAEDVGDLQYVTDTLPGSSGSPVLNDEWQVVALHRGSQRAANLKFAGREVAYVNRGTKMRSILEHWATIDPASHREIF